jgi:ferredoxin-NADP reductase
MPLLRSAIQLVWPNGYRQHDHQDTDSIIGSDDGESRIGHIHPPVKKHLGERFATERTLTRPERRKRGVVLSPHQRMLNKQRWESHLRSPQQVHRVVVVERIVKECEDMLSLLVCPKDGPALDFQPGQFVTCHFRIPSAQGGPARTIRRAYSLACAPGSTPLRLTIRQRDGGIASQYVHALLKAGDSFEITGPSGEFTLRSGPARRIFIAGGSGITPIRSQIDSLLQQDADSAITLIYANRNQRRIAFEKHFRTLEETFPNFNVIHVLSQPGKSWHGFQGRLDGELLRHILVSQAGFVQGEAGSGTATQFYLCGPDGLLDAVRAVLHGLGATDSDIRSERFLPAATNTLPQAQVSTSVRFRRSGRTVTTEPGETLLEAGLRAGIEMPYSCQVGGCGHCKVKVLSGTTISNEPNCLSDQEREQGYRLACQSYACDATEVDA